MNLNIKTFFVVPFFSALLASAANGTSTTTTTTTTTLKDLTPPTAPGKLSNLLISNTSIIFEWQASSDNVGVSSYSIYRNGIFHSSVPANQTRFEDNLLISDKEYRYSIVAMDAAGNPSPHSPLCIFRTLLKDDGLDHVLWRKPTSRENGDVLNSYEIKGYEIRYSSDGKEHRVLLPGNAYKYSAPTGSMHSPEIAVIDTNGLYSRFTTVLVK